MTKNKPDYNIRALPFQYSKIDKENRTIELIASTGAKFLRSNWLSEPVYEELEISERAVDQSRFLSRAPVLKDHNIYSVDNQVGVILRSWIDNGNLKVEIKFSQRENVRDFFTDVSDGIYCNVSIGYRINKVEIFKRDGEDYETVKVTNFTPHELSFVTVPVDFKAGVRSLDDDYVPQIILQHRSLLMSDNQNATNSQTVSNSVTASEPDNSVRSNPDPEHISSQVKELSKKDIMEINRICSEALLDLNRANEIINSVNSLEDAKVRVSEIILEDFKNRNSKMKHTPNISIGTDENQHIRSGIENALNCRIIQKYDNLNDNGKRFMYLSLAEMARMLVRNGELYNKVELYQRAITSTDLPLILTNIGDRILKERYRAIEKTYQNIVREREVKDLNIQTELEIGSFRELDDLGELEEYTGVSFGESAETYKTAKHGNKFSFSEELFINDRLDALKDIFAMFAESTERKLSTLVYNNFTINKLKDDKPLFHKDRKNISVENANKLFCDDVITEALMFLSQQEDVDKTKIKINRYKYIYTTTANYPIIKRVLAQISPTKREDVNIYGGMFGEPIIEDRLMALGRNATIFVCDPNEVSGIVLSHLQGLKEPQILRIDEPLKNAVTFTCKMFGGAKAIGYKGFFLHNPNITKP